MKSLLTDLFETITLWKTGITAATAERVGSAYQLTLDVEAKKFRSDSVGKDTEVPMNDLVDIAVFAPGNDLGKPLYLRKHRLKSGTQRITITLPERPARLAVDPYQLLIQRERERKDNVVSLTETTTDDSRKWRAEYRRR
jgi:hypothetical protein